MASASCSSTSSLRCPRQTQSPHPSPSPATLVPASSLIGSRSHKYTTKRCVTTIRGVTACVDKPAPHKPQGIECMRAAGKLAAQVLEYAGTLVQVRTDAPTDCTSGMSSVCLLHFNSSGGHHHGRDRSQSTRDDRGARCLPLTTGLWCVETLLPSRAWIPEMHMRYPGKFPKSVCTSVNECICHGIPDMRPLQEGDIVNIDVTVYLNVRPVSA